MRTAVLFTSKFCTTQRTAEYIAKALDADLFDIGKGTVPLDACGLIILGSGIYAGEVSRSMRNFVKNNIETLSEKKIALFVCCRFDGKKAEDQLSHVAEAMPPLSMSAYMSGRRKGKLRIDTDSADAFIASLR